MPKKFLKELTAIGNLSMILKFCSLILAHFSRSFFHGLSSKYFFLFQRENVNILATLKAMYVANAMAVIYIEAYLLPFLATMSIHFAQGKLSF